MVTQTTASGLDVSVEGARVAILDTVYDHRGREIRLTPGAVHELIDVLQAALRHIQDPTENRFGS